MCWGDHVRGDVPVRGGNGTCYRRRQMRKTYVDEARKDWGENCGSSAQYLEALKEGFGRKSRS